jgi:hypothetical protein
MTALPPSLSPSSILPPTPAHRPFIFARQKFGGSLKKFITSFLVDFVLRKSKVAKPGIALSW